MFSVGAFAVHPLHGAGTIEEISMRCCCGRCQRYYCLHLLPDDARIYIPVSRAKQLGLRPLCSQEEALAILNGEIGALPPQPHNWNQRYRENRARLCSGKPKAVAQVTACLWLKNRRRALTGSEKRLLECANRILSSELALATGMEYEEIGRRLEKQWQKLREQKG